MGKVIAGNWKMNLRQADAVRLAEGLVRSGRELWVFPAFVHVAAVGRAVAGSRVRLGAQDVSPEKDGAYTGDVSAEMLVDLGCSLALTGHSERRHGRGEDDALLLRKLRRTAEAGLQPVLCVGETAAERDAGKAREVVERQLAVLRELSDEERASVAAVAYEPVWAIGTGRVATTEQIVAMHQVVHGVLGGLGMKAPVLYGGSVKPSNAAEVLSAAGVDGALVGGASLKEESFLAIAEAAAEGERR